MQAVLALRAVASATALDALRRPGATVAVLGVGALLALLPRLGNPAAGVRDNAALATELTLTSVGMFGCVAAALLAVRGQQEDRAAGWSAELGTAPVSPFLTIVALWAGACLAAGVLCGVAALVGVLGWIGAATSPITASGFLAAAAMIVLAMALAAALGAFYGAVLRRELAIFVVLAHLATSGIWADAAFPKWFAPDPRRLDLAREVSFGGVPGAVGVMWIVVGVSAQVVACLCFAAALRARRVPRASL